MNSSGTSITPFQPPVSFRLGTKHGSPSPNVSFGDSLGAALKAIPSSPAKTVNGPPVAPVNSFAQAVSMMAEAAEFGTVAAPPAHAPVLNPISEQAVAPAPVVDNTQAPITPPPPAPGDSADMTIFKDSLIEAGINPANLNITENEWVEHRPANFSYMNQEFTVHAGNRTESYDVALTTKEPSISVLEVRHLMDPNWV